MIIAIILIIINLRYLKCCFTPGEINLAEINNNDKEKTPGKEVLFPVNIRITYNRERRYYGVEAKKVPFSKQLYSKMDLEQHKSYYDLDGKYF